MKSLLRYILAAIVAIVTTMPLSAITIDEIPNVQVANRNHFVSDPTGQLDASTVDAINRRLAALTQETTAEVVVVVVDKVDPSMTPRQMAYDIQSRWGVGKRDVNNGLVIFVSIGDRRAEIVTGRGLEGIIPDVVAGRIVRDVMVPHFKEGDYNGGVEAGVNAVASIIAAPENRDEILSTMTPDNDLTAEEFWDFYVKFAGAILLVMTVMAIYMFRSTRRLPLAMRYPRIEKVNVVMLMLSCLSLGAGFIVYYFYRRGLKRLRRGRHLCANCGHQMDLMDEETDNSYLTPSQDLEERLNSVDYDVWVCPECNEVDVIPYVNASSPYKECPRCGAHTLTLTENRVLRQPTTRTQGIGERVYTCRNCGNRVSERYTIPATPDPSAAVAGAVLGSMLGGRGGGGGGGIRGGGFGGGTSAGGGAGGSW
ncbi:MAG: TPM domain-containing protein [Muribaculaceae bacterium]|nr:TPM domain-containing protein [Muribaculaceae bacterium]